MQNGKYSLRKKQNISIFEQYQMDEEDFEYDKSEEYRHSRSRPKRRCKNRKEKMQEDYELDLSDDNMSEEDVFDPDVVVDRLSSSIPELVTLHNKVKNRIEFYK